ISSKNRIGKRELLKIILKKIKKNKKIST
ncbi:MAG: hypothetical protein CFH23_00493, partial [Alphaproteobacteria bacterium MarineAlpha6_Bin1]